MSSESLSAGISFATGLPRFVITTVSRLACTSSMTARQWILKEPAAIFFIQDSMIMVIIPWSYMLSAISSVGDEPIIVTRLDLSGAECAAPSLGATEPAGSK
jgi:hypothetical protein